MPSRRSNSSPTWSMYPTLHDEVSSLLEEDNLRFSFYGNNTSATCIKQHDTNIMGRFTCENNSCTSNGWSSKKIPITIRMYHGARYNVIVYHQRCRKCNKLAKPRLDESYAERVAYRLKKWRGVHVETPTYSGQSKGPHRRELCEGCKAGHCSESKNRL